MGVVIGIILLTVAAFLIAIIIANIKKHGSFDNWLAFCKQQKEEATREMTEAQANAQEWMSQFNESAKILKQTLEPAMFFSRYDSVVSTAKELADASNKGYVNMSIDIKQWLREATENKDKQINEFINKLYRKMLKSVDDSKTASKKIEKINTFFAEMDKYSDKMLPLNLELLKSHREECDNIMKAWEVE